MARRRLEEQGDTREEILGAAFRLFGRYGYDGVSMASVAEVAGVKKASLYYHYVSKEALFRDCNRRLHALFDAVVFDPMQRAAGAAARFYALFDGVQTLLRDPQIADGLAGYWLDSASSELDGVRRAHEEFTSRATEAIADVMREGISAGELRFDGDIRGMARSVLAVIEVLALPLRGRSHDEIASVVNHLGNTFLRAYLVSPH